MKIKHITFFALGWFCLAAAGCHGPSLQAPDVSHITADAPLNRFDREFFAIDTDKVEEGLSRLYKKYPAFLPVYLDRILNYGTWPDTGRLLRDRVRGFLAAEDLRDLEDTVNAHFDDLSILQHQLEEGFRYIKYYFPGFRTPKVVTFISGLNNYGAVTVDTVLGIGLDMFLGSDFPLYTQLAEPYPDYMLHRFEPEYIAADCFKVTAQRLFPNRAVTLLGQMIEQGKQLYFLDRVMPGKPDSLKIGYTGEQLDWCRENEQYIWQYFIQHDLLYKKDMQTILHFIGQGPSTAGMPPDAPGDIGSWVGWQIIRRYMSLHPETTLGSLMGMQDAQQLLNEARYKPH